MHWKRVLTALVFIPLFFGLVRYLPVYAFAVFIGAGALAALWEYAQLLHARGWVASRFVFVAAGLASAATLAFKPSAHRMLAASASLAVVFLVASLARPQRSMEQRFLSIGASLFGACCVGMGLGIQVPLRAHGAEWIFLLYLAVWLGDTFAFYVGRTLGRHPMAPEVSPRKTWEGAVGHVLGGLIGAIAAKMLFFHTPGWDIAVIAGILLSLAAQLGDLSISLLKRAAGAKDSGALLPGHGGVLDRADSLLFAAPLLFIYSRIVS
ncbi:MAG: phosphatidate cytidylyltransferase [Acidobacteriota bacterium]|nr:MAG: phosphatidate cytidylyltransferase [Acidobacteriota bacterium]